LFGKRRVDVHRVADDERRALVPAQHTGGHRPGNLQFADVALTDLLQSAVTVVGIIAGLGGPIRGIGNLCIEVGVCQGGGRYYRCSGKYGSPHQHCSVLVAHISSSFLILGNTIASCVPSSLQQLV
jgi:hypothetical protein